MGLFRKRKSRATRRAEARALKARAKLDAKLAAKNDSKRIKAAERSDRNAIRAQVKTQREADRAAVKVARTELRTAREGRVLSPSRVRRTLAVSRILAPVLVPVLYRAATSARGAIDELRADRLGVPLTELGRFSGSGGRLSARISSADHSLHQISAARPKDGETKQFVAAMTERLTALSAAVTAAESMPGPRRRAAHTSIGQQLDGIEGDLMARLGV